jgi:hypothetical protein
MIILEYQRQRNKTDSIYTEPLESVSIMIDDGIHLNDLLLQVDKFVKVIGYNPSGELGYIEETE